MMKIPSKRVIVGLKWNSQREITADNNSERDVEMVFTITLAYLIIIIGE